MAPQNPFLELKTRGLVLWALIGIIPLLVLWSILKRFVPSDQKLAENLTNAYAYLWVALWVHSAIRRHKIEPRKLFGNTGQIRPSLLLGLAIALLAFSLGQRLVKQYLLLRIWPGVFDLAGLHPISGSTLSIGALNLVLQGLVLLVLAPLTEETVFRGILFNRWAAKWGTRKAIVLSAGAFAIIDNDLLGAFVFGVCMVLLYMRTQTLWAPIIVHVSNNSIVLALIFATGASGPRAYSAASHPSFPWFGIGSVVLALPFIIGYIHKNWPNYNAAAPYAAEGESSAPVEAAK